MKTKLLLALTIFTCFLFSYEAIAQETLTLYYTNNWEVTSKEKASFYRIATYDLSTFKLDGPISDYTLDGKLLMDGNYDHDKKFGEFNFYYPDGKIKSSGRYLNNQRSAAWTYYFNSGKPKTFITFSAIAPELNFSVITHHDATGKQTITNGTGTWQLDSLTSWLFENKTLTNLTGNFRNGKKHGEWVVTQQTDGKKLQTEKFRDGELVSAEVYQPQFNNYGKINSESIVKYPDEHAFKFLQTENFKLDTTAYPASLATQDVTTILLAVTGKKYEIKNRQASHPEGDYGLMRYISTNIRYPIQAMRRREQGTVYVNVAISAQGKTTEVTILKGVSKELDMESIRVVKGVENWIPEIKNGESVSTIITVPVTFRMM